MFILKLKGHMIILVLYVDDIVLTGSCPQLLHKYIMLFLCNLIAMKDLGDLHYFLSVQVVCTFSGLLLSLYKYVLALGAWPEGQPPRVQALKGPRHT